MLRDKFLLSLTYVFLKTTRSPVYKNNTTNNVKNSAELKNIYSMNKYMNKQHIRKNTQ